MGEVKDDFTGGHEEEGGRQRQRLARVRMRVLGKVTGDGDAGM